MSDKPRTTIILDETQKVFLDGKPYGYIQRLMKTAIDAEMVKGTDPVSKLQQEILVLDSEINAAQERVASLTKRRDALYVQVEHLRSVSAAEVRISQAEEQFKREKKKEYEARCMKEYGVPYNPNDKEEVEKRRRHIVADEVADD